MKQPSNLPPGVTDDDIERAAGVEPQRPPRLTCSRCAGEGFLFQDEPCCTRCGGTGREPTTQP